MSKPLSIQLYTLRDYIAEDLAGTIAKVAALGLTQVEPYGFVERTEEYAAAFAAHNLTAPTAHAQMIGQDVQPILAAAKKLGIKTLVDPFTDPATWGDAEKVAGYAAEMNRIAAEAKEYGISVAYHNHFWEFSNKIDGQLAMDYFISKLNPEVVIELDTYWIEIGGVSAPEYVAKLGARAVALHIKDGKKDVDPSDYDAIRASQCPAGQGDIPVAAILAAAPHALPVIEFDGYSGDLFDGIAQSIAFIKGAQN